MRDMTAAVDYANDNLRPLCQDLRTYQATKQVQDYLGRLVHMCEEPRLPRRRAIARAVVIIQNAAVAHLTAQGV